MRVHSKSSLAVAALWALMLFLPLLAMLIPQLNVAPRLIENRRLAEAPRFDVGELTGYPEQFESYFNDHFGYRNLLIRMNSRFKRKVLKIKNSKDKVLVGNDGWLFYTGDSALDDYQGVNPLSVDQLERWRRVLEQKQDWLKARGVAYLFVVAPNKSSIYPEYVPDWINKVKDETPLDQLVAYLGANSTLEILDLRAALRAEKGEELLYIPTDTHWNRLGAFAAHREIIARLAPDFPQLTALSLDDLSIVHKTRDGGDLAQFLGTQDDVVESVPTPVLKNPQATQVYKDQNEHLMESSREGLPRVVMFRDSFAAALIPYLSESFSSARYLYHRWDAETPIAAIVAEHQPDIVIEEWAERFIDDMELVGFQPGH